MDERGNIVGLIDYENDVESEEDLTFEIEEDSDYENDDEDYDSDYVPEEDVICID